MRQKTIDNVVLVIIDQLRADYADFMPLCRKLLPFHSTCDTKSYPSSTEPTHATISTATTPAEHGFISKETRNGVTGLLELVDKFDSGEVIPLALTAKESGFSTYVIGGKPETVEVMGRGEECSLRVVYYNNSFEVDGTDKNKVDLMKKLLKDEEYDRRLSRAEQDVKLLEFLNLIMSDEKADRSLYVACLPGLDEVGHTYGPGSEMIIKHLNSIDRKLAYLIEKHGKDTSFIITGDHGCRNIRRYLIEVEYDAMTMAVYKAENNKFEFIERHTMESKEEIHGMEYNGGNLRIWFKDNRGHLTSNDMSFIQKYGEIQPVHDRKKVEFYHKSNHPNQGDITIIAHEDAMFCKKEWIEKEVRSKVSEFMDLNDGDLPKGEHGTYHDEDRIVAFMSDYDFGIKEIQNTIVPLFVRKLMM